MKEWLKTMTRQGEDVQSSSRIEKLLSETVWSLSVCTYSNFMFELPDYILSFIFMQYRNWD